MTNLILGYAATSVHVNDIEKARKFYSNVLGLKEIQFDPQMNTAYFAIPGVNVPLSVHKYEGYCRTEMPGRAPGTVSGIVFAVDDVHRAVTEIKNRGGRITDQPDKRPWGSVTATVADPDGNEFVLTAPN